MSKRGLSFEEKRTRLKQLFLETKSVFTLKELEKVASKEKGIVSKTVEEVLKSLVDDGEVMTDKVGTSNYFWCFPSQELVLRKNKADAMRKELEAQRSRLAELTAANAQLLSTRPESAERKALLEELHGLQRQKAALEDEIAQFAENDPAILVALGNDAQRNKDGANRWTDNIFTLRKYCETKFSLDAAAFNQQFEIPEEMDYVE